MIPSAADCTKFSNDHGGARSNRRPAVGNFQRVWLRHAYVFVWKSESFGGDLAEHSFRTLAKLRARNQHAYAAIGTAFYAHNGTQIALARARESCTVQKRGNTHAFSGAADWLSFAKLFFFA